MAELRAKIAEQKSFLEVEDDPAAPASAIADTPAPPPPPPPVTSKAPVPAPNNYTAPPPIPNAAKYDTLVVDNVAVFTKKKLWKAASEIEKADAMMEKLAGISRDVELVNRF